MFRKNKTVVVVLGSAALMVFVLLRPAGQRICGHKRYPFEDMLASGAPDDCKASYEHGSFATSLSQLSNGFSMAFLDMRIQFYNTGNCWSCLVPRSGDLPGSYLLCSDGKLYFSERDTPTTNSTLLRDNKTGL